MCSARTTLDVRLVDADAFEPGLVVDVRNEKRALFFDLGKIDRGGPTPQFRRDGGG